MNAKKKNYPDIHRKLIEECKKGSRKAQFEIYRLYYKAMFNASLRIVGKMDEAEDIMQESFLKAFNSLGSYRGEVSFGAWLKKIVINRSLDTVRKKKWIMDDIEDHEDDLEESVEAEGDEVNISIQDIAGEIQKLPDGYRIVLSLHLLEGYDHDEIAEIMDITSSTSRSQFARARKKLAHNLKKKYNERD
ncbi:MAG: RNA polymerase sigma factor [Bacteroidota bacterium]